MKPIDKDVVKILEWLGWKFLPEGGYKKRDIWVSPDKEYELEHSLLPEYLQSAEGERAMMNKLIEQGCSIFIQMAGDSSISCCLGREGVEEVTGRYVEINAPTRIEALINAILEMPKNDKR